MAQPSKLKIDISDNAVLKIQALLNQQGEQGQDGQEGQEGQEGKGLRVKVVGGGCSGLSYKMNLDAQRDGDRVFEREDVKVLVDRKSFLYLRGTELDYSESLMDSGFKLNNPNVKRSCGCGSSFSV